MIRSQVAKRYAKILINTIDTSYVPSVLDELKIFSRLIDSDRRLRLLFTGYVFSEEEKGKALNEVLSYMKAGEDTRRFLNLITSHGVLYAINEIIGSAIGLYREKIGKTTAEIVTPVPLKDDQIDRLRSALSALTKRDVEINRRLDPSVIGGLIVKVGSTIYDSSLKGQLTLLKAELAK